MTPQEKEQFEEALQLMERTRNQVTVLVAANIKRVDGCLERIDMMTDILEQTVSLLRIKGTAQDMEFVANIMNMVAACRKFVSDQRAISETQSMLAKQM